MSSEREGDEQELEALLRRAPPPAPDPSRRAAARAAFLAASRSAEAARMRLGMAGGAAPESLGLGPAEERFAAWVARAAPVSPADAGARQRARLAFLGVLGSENRRLRRETRAFRGLVLVLAAAGIAAVTFFLPEPERWSVRLDGPLRFADEDFAVGDGPRLAAALESSGVVETVAARARFSLSHALEIELLPGAALEFPALPELDGAAPLAFELTRGEAYLRTRRGYPGNPILLRAGVADVSLHGTTVGLLRDEQGTCVCVSEGTARVTSAALASGAQDVGPRSTLRLFQAPGMAPKSIPFPASGGSPETAHTDDLLAFEREP